MEQRLSKLPDNCLNYDLPVVFADLQLPSSCLSPVALELPAGLSVQAWIGLHPALLTVHSAAAWWLGDWSLYGEQAYGEEAEQGLDRLGHTWRIHAWVAKKIPPERRRLALSWSHHREVARLVELEADLLLDAAEREQWSVQRLREAIAEQTGKTVHRRADKGAAAQYSQSRVGQSWTAGDHAALLTYLGMEGGDGLETDSG